jgi:hypothetical protein
MLGGPLRQHTEGHALRAAVITTAAPTTAAPPTTTAAPALRKIAISEIAISEIALSEHSSVLRREQVERRARDGAHARRAQPHRLAHVHDGAVPSAHNGAVPSAHDGALEHEELVGEGFPRAVLAHDGALPVRAHAPARHGALALPVRAHAPARHGARAHVLA